MFMVFFAVQQLVSLIRPHLFVCLFIYLSIYGCVGSSFLCEGPLQLWQVGATLHRGARAPHHRGLYHRGAQAPDAQAQQLWLTGPAAPWHVGSSGTRARTHVPCTGRRTPNHCATREAPFVYFCFYFYCLERMTLRNHCYNLCQRMFCLCSLLGVLWCHVLYLSL